MLGQEWVIKEEVQTMKRTDAKPDFQIRQDVRTELSWDPRVDQGDITVDVDAGIVTLTGTVPSYAARRAAQEAARRVWGVLDIVNDLGMGVAGGPLAADTRIAAEVRHALTHVPFVHSENIRTTIANGLVTLEGEVDVPRQRTEVEDAVHHVPGVVGVANCVVVKNRRASAGEIREAMRRELERRVEQEADGIQVILHDGSVTLRGPVRSCAEKRAALAAVSRAPGVTAIDDELQVSPYA
jgi:osmotically-inducible protein OsmY